MREEKTRISEVSRILDRKRDGVAAFVQIYGGDLGKKYALDKVETQIGRGPDNAIVVDMDNVSRCHCKVYTSRGGHFIEDMGSTNGTFCNDIEVVERKRMTNGDLVKVGGAIFKFLDGNNIEQAYYEEIYRMAIVDGLTQTYNKRYFLEFIEREIARCHRYKRPLTLVMFDIDHFKAVNDDFGHLAGDYVLKRMAGLIAETNIRKEECFARYGGEEFAVVLPDTMPDRGVILAEKIRKMIEETVFEFEDNIIPIRLSLGVAELARGDSAEQFISRADELLYKAKDTGRNCVCH